jgi:thioredoxin-like negative regulator of GroEL
MQRAWIWGLAAWGLLVAVPGARAGDAEGHPVELTQGSTRVSLGARFRPMSASAPLRTATSGAKNGLEHRGGTLAVGAKGQAGRRFVVSRTKAGEAFDVLLLDQDGDGSLDDETPLEARLQSSGQTVWSIWNVVLRIDHGTPGHPSLAEHPFRLWLAVRSKDEKPDALHYASVGFRHGRVQIGGRDYDVVLSDRTNDGRYGPGDAWTIRAADEPGRPEAGDASDLADAVEAGGRHWKLVLDDGGGRSARVVEEGGGGGGRAAPAAALPHAGDRALPRARKPLAFAGTMEAGRKQAAKIQGPLFVSFESDASADTLALRELVYTARAVVDAAAGLTCARVDADASPGLVAAWKVEEVPTGILLDPQGGEVARFSGYVSVARFCAFLAAVHPWLRPADDEPALRGADRKRQRAEVASRLDALQDRKHQGLLVDRIRELGTQGNRAARDALIQFATTRKSKQYVAEAFLALARIGGRVAVEFLSGSHALGSKDFLVAQKAAEALAKARDARGVDALLAVLDKRGTKIEVVSACCLALARSAPKDARVVEALLARAADRKDTIRAAAAEALGYLHSDEALARLRDLVAQDGNTHVRESAALGLGHTGRTELVELLRKVAAEDKAHTVRTAALKAVRELQGETPGDGG